MVVFIIFFYFVVIRPQNKRKKEMEKMINELKKGDKVVTIGGVHGKVVSVKDDVVVLKVDDNAEITFEKSAIARVNNPVLNNASKDSKETKKIEDNLENNKSENNNN
jgi:preprotein translocase subunit YajC